jgi:hypothetical protein
VGKVADWFLSRWSRRKQDAREAPAEAAAPAPTAAAPGPEAPAEPLPTLDDVAALTPQSDFSRFVARGVAPGVRTAALKKLFTDPHFNTMDGLDIYIGDYTQADPLPESMLRHLASARSAGLFREEEQAAAEEKARDSTPDGVPAVAKSDAPVPPSAPVEVPDAHPDLRLQQDDAAEGGEPGRGAG